MDEQRLEAGSDWRADIGNGILNASIIISPVSIVSDWCIKELNMGKNNGKLIWPAWYQKAEVPLSLSILFSTQTFADLSEENLFDAHIVKLVAKLKATLAKIFAFELHREVSALTPLSQLADDVSETPHLFLDYTHNDAFIAKTLKYQLSENGILCMDPEAIGDLPPPDDIASSQHNISNGTDHYSNFINFGGNNLPQLSPNIIRVIEGCWVFLLIVSSADIGLLSARVRASLLLADKLNKPLIAVLVSNNLTLCDENSHLANRISSIPTFHFTLQHATHTYSSASMENIKRMVYIIELLYKEHTLEKQVKVLLDQKLLKEQQTIRKKKY